MFIQLYGLIVASALSTTMSFFHKFVSPRVVPRSFQLKRCLQQSYVENAGASKLNEMYVFTRPGCKYCRIAKATLNEYGLPYNEIDISIDTINESFSKNTIINAMMLSRLAYTKSHTVPQIYIGDEHIGGCEDLLNQIKNNTFVETLKRWNIPINTNVQLNRTPDIDDTNINNLIKTMNTSTSTSTINQSKLSYLNQFYDSSSSTLPPPLELSKLLQRTILELSDQFISTDGKKVKYKAMANSFEFQQYCLLSSKLSYYTIHDLAKSLNNHQKLSFLVNIYNAMIIHATCIIGTPDNTPLSRSLFFNGTTGALYNISGYLFSPDDIEHGLIRANTAHPSQAARGLIHYFNKNTMNDNDNKNDSDKNDNDKNDNDDMNDDLDPRSILSLSPPLDPRIHFILNCGASSCPPIAVLGDDPEEALVLAARTYLETEVKIDVENRVVYLPKLLLWYGADFGASISERLGRILAMLSQTKRDDIVNKLKQLGWDNISSISSSSNNNNNNNSSSSNNNNSSSSSNSSNSSSSDDKLLPFAVEYNAYDWTSNAEA